MKDVDLGKLRIDRSGAPKAAAPRSKRFSWKTWAIGGAALVIVAWLLLPGTAEVQTTQAVSAWPSQAYVLLDATGYVTAKRKAAVASKGTGRVEWVGFSEGDHVSAGTVVARLESRDVAAQHAAAAANSAMAGAALQNARSELEDAQRQIDRAETLYGKRMVALNYLQEARSRFGRAKAGVASANASLQAARANEQYALSAVEYTEIRAPFDGVVISRSANVGDIVTPLSSAADAKGAVMAMADMSQLSVDAEVSESALAQVKSGQPCEIVLDAFPDKRYRGEVAIIVPAVNRSSATVTVKVRILDTDPAILPDMSARVSFLSQASDPKQQSVTAVNPQAIVTQGEGSRVFVIDGERVRAVSVTPGATLGGVRAVQGELKAGDTVVLNPGKLDDGDRVKRAGAP